MAESDSLHRSEENSEVTLVVRPSNKAMNPNVDLYPAPMRITAVAILHSYLDGVATASASVPLDLVTEAVKSFKVIRDNKFQFRLFNKNWNISQSKFCYWLSIPAKKRKCLETNQLLKCMNLKTNQKISTNSPYLKSGLAL